MCRCFDSAATKPDPLDNEQDNERLLTGDRQDDVESYENDLHAPLDSEGKGKRSGAAAGIKKCVIC